MSVYLSKLVSRDNINWEKPGTWREGEDITRLRGFAERLHTEKSTHTDLLSSIPSPWARLLLFENALYDNQHPSHTDIKPQWRGLMGVLALQNLLNLKVNVIPFRLDSLPNDMKISFLNAMPAGSDLNISHLIQVDGVVIGAISPRTLVFTGVDYKCPDSIPFLSPDGRLSDPVPYYQKFGDNTFLNALAYWLDSFLQSSRVDNALRNLLGQFPAAQGDPIVYRLDKLNTQIEEWRNSITNYQAMQGITVSSSSGFPAPYSIIRPLMLNIAQAQRGIWNQSDLLLNNRDDVIVLFKKDKNSELRDRNGKEIIDASLRIWDGHWCKANEPLPAESITFLPSGVSCLKEPDKLLEDTLIGVTIIDTEKTHSLECNGQRYLLPFKEQILNYINTIDSKIESISDNILKVEWNIPITDGKKITVWKEYHKDKGHVIEEGKINISRLAMWPEFRSNLWSQYFFYKQNPKGEQILDFLPIGEISLPRELQQEDGLRTWYMAEKPLKGFIGKVHGKQGLLPIVYHYDSAYERKDKSWKVGIDLGSTHTRAFFQEVIQMEKDKKWVPPLKSEIKPIDISPKIKELTGRKNSDDLFENFFRGVNDSGEDSKVEFFTQLIMPKHDADQKRESNWLAREGFIYFGSLLTRNPEAHKNKLEADLKWNVNQNNYALQTFLRCLMLFVKAYALKNSADIVSLSHAYPSVFTRSLISKHHNEWKSVSIHSKIPIHEITLTESVAVARYLQLIGAPINENVISLDIGGSTTDIAIWKNSNLAAQESIKLAAGVMGRYIEGNDNFREHIENILSGTPFENPVKFQDKKKYSQIFNTILNDVALGVLKGSLEQFVECIWSYSDDTRRLIAYIHFIFGAILYYTGLLVRKHGIADPKNCHIYFCGKGGLFIKWVEISANENYKKFVREMFYAGLQRGTTVSASLPHVNVNISPKPKQEVGMGVLDPNQSGLQDNNKRNQKHGFDATPPSVTVGEEGYTGLQWNDELNADRLISLKDIPKPDCLKELNTFVETFLKNELTKPSAKLLGLEQAQATNFQTKLGVRLLTMSRGGIVNDIEKNPDEAMIEPLFITEVKVLFEVLTGICLFDIDFESR